MSTTLTTRIPDELYREIERISQEEHVDKSALTRRLLERAVRDHKLTDALERYQEGTQTLRGAAQRAGRPLVELIAEMDRRDIAFSYDLDDLEEDLKGPVDA